MRVAILGYGVIGRRLATAVGEQPDMQVVGIAGRRGSVALDRASQQGFPTYTVGGASETAPLAEFDELLSTSDVLLDCTPSEVPEQYREHMERFPKLITIVQGGETPDRCDVSFNSMTNFAKAAGRKRIRVISCSSTGITRFLFALQRAVGVKDAFATLARRAADPGKLGKVPINSLVPTMGPSHHARDVRTVFPEMRLFSVSVDCPTTIGHVIWCHVNLTKAGDRSRILEELKTVPRIRVGCGIDSTHRLAEHCGDLGRYRRDWPEIYVFDETLQVQGARLTAALAVHMESITIPETVDCIRAASGLASNRWRSIALTDECLGIFQPHARYADNCHSHVTA